MGKAVKVAISIPEEVLEAVERERQARGETRSEFFRHAVESVLRRARAQEAVERYVQGYREHPETNEDVAALRQAGSAILGLEPWE